MPEMYKVDFKRNAGISITYGRTINETSEATVMIFQKLKRLTEY